MTKYLVNHGGVVHSVNDEGFARHLGMASKKPTEADPAGKPAREATSEEVSAWYAKQGLVYDPATGDAHPADSTEAKMVLAAQKAAAAEAQTAQQSAGDSKADGKGNAGSDSKASK